MENQSFILNETTQENKRDEEKGKEGDEQTRQAGKNKRGKEPENELPEKKRANTNEVEYGIVYEEEEEEEEDETVPYLGNLEEARDIVKKRKQYQQDRKNIPAFLLRGEDTTTEEDDKMRSVILIEELKGEATYKQIADTIETVSSIDRETGYSSTKGKWAIVVLAKEIGRTRGIEKAKEFGRVSTRLTKMSNAELDPEATFIAYAEIHLYQTNEGISPTELGKILPLPTKWIRTDIQRGTILMNFFTEQHMKEWIQTSHQLGGKTLKKKESFINQKDQNLKLWAGNIPKKWKNNDVKNFFNSKGLTTTDATVLRHHDTNQSKGCCFITFASHSTMLAAYLSFFKLKGGAVIEFDEPKGKEETK